MDVQTLVVQQLPCLNRYACYLTRNRGRADDLVQDTVLRALTRLDRWKVGTDLRAWLFSIMHNQYVNYVRSGVREAKLLADTRPSIEIVEPQERSVELADLARAFAHLPGDVQEIVWLIAVDGVSYDETAALLRIPIGTVRSRLSRGRKHLRDLVEGRVAARRARRRRRRRAAEGSRQSPGVSAGAELHRASSGPDEAAPGISPSPQFNWQPGQILGAAPVEARLSP